METVASAPCQFDYSQIFSQSPTVFVKKSTQKSQFRGTPSGSQPAFACRPALKSTQQLKKHVFVHFQTFFVDFRHEINKKG